MSINDKISFSSEQQKMLKALLGNINSDQALWLSGFLAGFGASGSLGAAESSGASIPLFILYGSESGNSENLADKAGKLGKKLGFKPIIKSMQAVKMADLVAVKNLLVVVSTWGEGDPPERAVNFFKEMKSDAAPKLPETLNYAVLSLGDTSYVNFCQAGKDVDSRFEQLGAKRFFNRLDCDVDYESSALKWLNDLFPKLLEINGVSAEALAAQPKQASKSIDLSAIFGGESEYTQNNPFIAEVKDKILLNDEGSEKETFHLEINLEGSGIRYEVGDALGIIPLNDKNLVAEILKVTKLNGDEEIDGKKLINILTEDYDITNLTKPVIENYAHLTENVAVGKILKLKDISEYTYGRGLIDFLSEFPYKNLTAKDLIKILRKLPHRLYSISSSQNYVGDEVHLTITTVRYNSFSKDRKGVASGFVADDIKAGDKIKIFPKTNKNFRLPEDTSKPVIMVGPGTGIAPFRAFLQEREAVNATGKNWLFFGEQRYLSDFYYQLEIQDFKEKNILTNFDAAFSRDKPEKVYVQHKMWDRRKELFSWLEQGAYFYVCGDEKRMAKDVDACLHKIISEQSGKGDDFAKEYVEKIKQENRYLRDVY